MRKLSLILAVLLLAAMLGGCGSAGSQKEPVSPSLRVPALEGEPLQPDTTGLKEYALDNGIRFHAVKGLNETEVDGMAAYLRNTFFLVMVIQEPKTGTVLESVDLAGYGEMLATQNGLAPFVTDRYGSLATTNTAVADGTDDLFFYYVTIHETADSIWLVQIACHDDLAQSNLDDMAMWSASFRFPGEE